ncbi:uracil-DNA glycosylase [bacterium]|nr:uracil-DNA glycosylase [bacterium]
MSKKPSYIPCGLCLNYFVTFDVKRPHGCKKFGFKSTQSPSLEVFSATGMNCALYKRRFRPTDGTKVKTHRRLK